MIPDFSLWEGQNIKASSKYFKLRIEGVFKRRVKLGESEKKEEGKN